MGGSKVTSSPYSYVCSIVRFSFNVFPSPRPLFPRDKYVSQQSAIERFHTSCEFPGANSRPRTTTPSYIAIVLADRNSSRDSMESSPDNPVSFSSSESRRRGFYSSRFVLSAAPLPLNLSLSPLVPAPIGSRDPVSRIKRIRDQKPKFLPGGEHGKGPLQPLGCVIGTLERRETDRQGCNKTRRIERGRPLKDSLLAASPCGL